MNAVTIQPNMPVASEDAPALPHGYKQTDIGVIPDDWEVVSIGDIAKFTSGASIAVSALHSKSSNNPVPVYGGNGIAGYTSSALVSSSSVVVGRVGQKCGAVYLTDGPAWITDNALYAKRMYRTMEVRFFALALEGAKLNEIKNRNDLPLVTQSTVRAVRIACPRDFSEQRLIAEALSDVDKLITALDKLIAKKQAIKQAAMQRLLTGKARLPGFGSPWNLHKLGDLGSWKGGLTPAMANPSYWASGKVPWVSSSDVRQSIVGDVNAHITERAIQETSIPVLKANSVLVVVRSGILRRFLPVARSIREVAINQDKSNHLAFASGVVD